MKRSASIRFDHVLAAGEREIAARTLRSAGATVTSWNDAGQRSYAALSVEPAASLVPLPAGGDGRIDEPPLVVLRITPAAPERLAALAGALGGAGRPHGVTSCRLDGAALIVELRAQTTPLAFIVALVDVELAPSPGRRIEPLLPLDDVTLTAFARDVLAEPDLDANRLIETHLDPLLATVLPGDAS
ncbi:MAG: hypothetical protein M3R53_04910 [Candidatus Eremiobacteraeota bacterium]|nr:hypothetical protein [Candidatus Eremiobacteraeota bacterium]